MKLTIGMIVKNEEKWLDKCLSGIKPILDNVDSELIITDTGSTDKTVEIAKKYTDKVLHFDWIKDFSAARNFGLEKAQGEWFMMLDADDIFRSCDHIIEFFNSGEYKKYNAASYISRNVFKTENGDSYGDIQAPRMVKLHPHTRYEGAVHEYLTTFDPPYKKLNDIADHYGYYYETEEDKFNKFKRNSELLLQRFENEKDTKPMLYVQLYEAFMGIKEYDKALFYLDGGIELSKKRNSIVLATLYFHKASYFQTDKRFEEAISVCDEYFQMNKVIRPYPLTTDGEIYAIKAVSLHDLERYAEAVDTFKKFFDIYRDIESGKIATYDSYLMSSYMCSEINIMPLFNEFIESCIKSGKLNTADSYLSTYPIYKYSFEPRKISELVDYELEVAQRFEFKSLPNYYKKLNDLGKKILEDELFDCSGKVDNKEQVFTALGYISKNDNKTARKIAVYKAYYAGEDCLAEINDFLMQFGITEDIDIIYLILKKNYDLSPVLSEKGLDIKKIAYLCCKNIEGFYEAAESYDSDIISVANALSAAVKFYDYCISMRLMENEDKSEEEKKQLIGKLFSVKAALNERYKRSTARSEFEQLAEMIKNNVRAYIAAGNVDAAKKTLEDYRKINPNDLEIITLEKEVLK